MGKGYFGLLSLAALLPFVVRQEMERLLVQQ